MHIMSTNFAKTLVWKHEYDVKLWRHKQRTPNTNDHHMPLNETPQWKISAYATVPSNCRAQLDSAAQCGGMFIAHPVKLFHKS